MTSSCVLGHLENAKGRGYQRCCQLPERYNTFLLDDEAVLLHMSTQHYYTLNETGSFIWQRLERGCSIDEIRSELEQHYDVSSEQAAQSITALLQELCAEHLISLADAPSTDTTAHP